MTQGICGWWLFSQISLRLARPPTIRQPPLKNASWEKREKKVSWSSFLNFMVVKLILKWMWLCGAGMRKKRTLLKHLISLICHSWVRCHCYSYTANPGFMTHIQLEFIQSEMTQSHRQVNTTWRNIFDVWQWTALQLITIGMVCTLLNWYFKSEKACFYRKGRTVIWIWIRGRRRRLLWNWRSVRMGMLSDIWIKLGGRSSLCCTWPIFTSSKWETR